MGFPLSLNNQRRWSGIKPLPTNQDADIGRMPNLRDNSVNQDNAGVIAWPPLIFAVCVGMGIVVHFVHAVPIASRPVIRWLGGCLAVCSAALAIWAVRVMKAAGTNVK